MKRLSMMRYLCLNDECLCILAGRVAVGGHKLVDLLLKGRTVEEDGIGALLVQALEVGAAHVITQSVTG
jgi:hypothetical protein